MDSGSDRKTEGNLKYLAEFMGKYYLYIWAAFGFTFTLMIFGALWAYLTHSGVVKELKSQKGINTDAN